MVPIVQGGIDAGIPRQAIGGAQSSNARAPPPGYAPHRGRPGAGFQAPVMARKVLYDR